MFRFGRSLKKMAKPFLDLHRSFQVAVLGASRPLGQSLSLLLKQHPLVKRLTLYDLPEKTIGVAMDISHIPREPVVEGWAGRMEFALRCADLVVVTCGEPRKAGQTDHDLFKENAPSIVTAMQEIAPHCPNAFIVIATEPINYTVPLASKVLELGDAYDKRKVFGVTGVDTMRTQTWLGGVYQLEPHLIKVPVICGHSSRTTIPLVSHIMPRFEINDSTAYCLTEAIRKVDDDITVLKGGCGESTLSSAYATFCTVSAILNAMTGFSIEHVAFVANNDYGTKFFASPVIITWQGISAIMQFKVITSLEADYINHSTEKLADDVRQGESYLIRHSEKLS